MYQQSLSPVRQVDFALFLVFVFSAVVLVLLTGMTCWFIWRYHHKRNPVPSDVRGNVTVEVLWTVIPTLMVMGLFYYGWTGYKALRSVPEDAMPVKVTAKMFSWTFTYASGKSSAYLAVPVGVPVRLNMHAVDVIHSLFVPAFRIKMDTVPGMETYAWFKADRPGEYDIYCAEYCGRGHSGMLSKVRAMSAEDFSLWLAENGMGAGAKAGHDFMEAQGCFSCHSMDGDASMAPPLNGLFGKKVTVIENGKEKERVADEAYLKEAIADPGKDLVKGYDNTMPPYTEVTPEEMGNMLEYLRSIAGDESAAADHAGMDHSQMDHSQMDLGAPSSAVPHTDVRQDRP